MLIRAKYVLWKAGERPIENGAVIVRGQRIAAVGASRSFQREVRSDKVLDLGEVILLPGLINAHCHINYTKLAGKLSPPSSFTEWIRGITALKRAASPQESAEAVRTGLRQLRDSGVTTVCDIVSDTGGRLQSRTTLRKVLAAAATSSLRVWSFLELYDVGKPERPEDILAVAAQRGAARDRFGISPHAPYTVSSLLFRASSQLARRRHWPVTVHLSESADEFEMFSRRRGPLFEAISRFGADLTHCGGTTPIQWVDSLRVLGPRTLGVHLNYLAAKDFDIIARSGMSVVHCPRSHEYFSHRRFPLERLRQLGVNVCLGTDSVASMKPSCHSGGSKESHPLVVRVVPDPDPVSLDMFAEMRTLHRHHPRVSPSEILRMATLNGARALHQEGRLGSIEANKSADLIAVHAPGGSRPLEETVLYSTPRVAFSMVAGRLVA